MEGIVFSFTGITTQLKNGIEKKELHDLPFGWKDLTQSSINPSHKGFGRLTGKVAGITVFDFDNIESFDKFWDDHPTLNIYDYKMVQTRKGFHVYFEYDADCKQGTNVSNKYEGVDIRNDGGFVICPPSHYTCLDGSVFTYKNSCGKILPVPNEFKSILKGNEVKTINKTISKCSDDIIVELSSIIDIKYIDNYSDWIKLVWAFSNEEKYYDLAKQVSQRSSKYEDKCFDDLWKSSKKKITLGTIYYYAKKSNPEEYMNIIIKYSTNQIEEILKNPTQENMARCFISYVEMILFTQMDKYFISMALCGLKVKTIYDENIQMNSQMFFVKGRNTIPHNCDNLIRKVMNINDIQKKRRIFIH